MTSNSSNNQITPDLSKKDTLVPVSPVSTGTIAGKEREVSQLQPVETVQEVSREMQIPKEVIDAGVVEIGGTIELPPDMKKLGIRTTGPTTPVAQSIVLPKVALPISDTQVIAGLHTQISSALRWLAVWCIRRLQKAHLMLKTVHGKVVRVFVK